MSVCLSVCMYVSPTLPIALFKWLPLDKVARSR
jgi:hypothetical protein